MNIKEYIWIVILLLSSHSIATSQGYFELANLTATDVNFNERVGFAVDHEDTQLIVGSIGDQTDENNMNPILAAGAAYIYTMGSPIPQKIVPSDRGTNDNFGYAVAIEGDYAVIGKFNYLTTSKKAYIFKKNSAGLWQEFQILNIPYGISFGHALDINNGTIVVGDPRNRVDENNLNILNLAGAIYIFDLDTAGSFVLTQKVVPAVRFELTYFGHSVSKHDGRIVVGARSDNWNEDNVSFSLNAGSSYIFHQDSTGNWNEKQKIVASDRVSYQYFGEDVAIHGDFAAVGASFEKRDANGLNSISEAGATYLYKYNNSTEEWDEIQKIVAEDRLVNQRFGWSIDMSDGLLAIGAPWGEDQFIEVYKDCGFASWTYFQNLTPSDGHIDDRFGWSVSTTETFIMGGAQTNNILDSSGTTQFNAGSVYVFYNFPCDLPSITNAEVDVNCLTNVADISITGNLNSPSNSWHVYTGDCGDNLIGISNVNNFSTTLPAGTTAIFIRGEDGPGCVNEECGVCFNVTIGAFDDNIQPVAVCQDITVYLDNAGTVSIVDTDIDGGSYDNCGNVNMAAAPLTYDCDDIGDNTATLQIWDDSGNSAFCNATVTVSDTMNLVVDCMDITISLDASGNTSITEADIDGGTYDNCNPVFMAAAPKNFNTTHLGDNTVWLQVWNNYGEFGYCTANVHVVNYSALVTNDSSDPTSIILQKPNDGISEVGYPQILSEHTEIKIFPNPAISEFTISSSSKYPIDKVSVLNSYLSEVKTYAYDVESNERRLSTDGLSQGIYFIMIYSGEETYVQKLIKL